MIRFADYIMLKEGGHAVSNVTRVNQENAIPTFNDIVAKFLPALGLKKSDVELLGSVGKKAPNGSSGDIDIAVSAPALLKQKGIESFEDIMFKIGKQAERLGLEHKIMVGIGIVSISYPITNADGKQPGQFVQTDFMIVDDIHYSKWAYFSPSYLESKYSGFYRNKLMFAIAKHVGFKVLDTHKETGQPIKWKRHVLSLDKGLDRGIQTNISPKTGAVTKKTTMLARENLTKDPDAIIKMLFGPKYRAKDILTWEQAFKALLDPAFPHKAILNHIIRETADSLNEIGVPIPPELDRVLGV